MGAREFACIAAATSVSVDTVRRYYAGKPVTAVNRAVIEKACVALDYPLAGEAPIVPRRMATNGAAYKRKAAPRA